MPSTNEYYKEYRRGERAAKNGEREDLIEERVEVKFKSKGINLNSFKKVYKNKIKDKEQEYIFNNCLDLIELIQASKNCLEQEGAYVKNVTGTLKVNPAQKELRENLKAFTNTLQLLHDLIGPDNDDGDLEGWLND